MSAPVDEGIVLDDPTPMEQRTAHDWVLVSADWGNWANSIAGHHSGAVRAADRTGPWPFAMSVPRWMATVILPLDYVHRSAIGWPGASHPKGTNPPAERAREAIKRCARRAAADREYAEALWGVHLLFGRVGGFSSRSVKRLLAFIRETVDVAR